MTLCRAPVTTETAKRYTLIKRAFIITTLDSGVVEIRDCSESGTGTDLMAESGHGSLVKTLRKYAVLNCSEGGTSQRDCANIIQ